ncbi:GLPGLI family protein [Flavobacterium sp. xlx-214]|uniref:GLPGLI family protein n=1 Tax=unclassified Flavobacterium TaxID=196869 RepID=UPI0013D13DDB|nr:MULTISPECIES: GLPGLI family protein [unclassified Flavobacterium]MBA5791899.1 GLPGLI family protein [Flavobacterium sp. xlx-221]QMI83132.1 GLPGLI family protein [Flavobacterium sp. xlx-214]
MNKILLVLLCFCYQMVFAQTNDYKITYKRFEGNRKRDAVLYVKESQATVMHDIVTSTVPIKVIKDTTYINENGATVWKSGSGSTDYSKFPDEYIKVDHAKNKIEMIRDIRKKFFLVTDELNYKWIITNETKKINDFTCYKATTTFRGNNFEAWFTPDIPINAGPWKWYGLPGLIVEATDTDKSVVFKLEKVEKLIGDVPFPSEKLAKITLQEYFKKGKEADDAFTAQLNDRNVKVTSTVIGRFGLERVYEWEEEAKK